MNDKLTYSKGQVDKIVDYLNRMTLSGIDNAVNIVNIIQILNQPIEVESNKSESDKK